MARDTASREDGNAFTHFFDRIDRALLPVFGPPPVTADEAAQAPNDEKACPICGHAMLEHVIDHSTPNTVLVCPTDERLPEREVAGPYNELGMPATGRRLVKYTGRGVSR
ncbi:hypothetical protein DCE93_07340 [Agromyces badenianii]|uniref:Uncharacterized protein n=1 Tax=Agromyces badenianii TaxID=2080742 RepID=A0A2S0WVX8_9MICO|nr:hypothetical protein [Agromyces badenianii]AWB95497.1 hypothetical protein DCE93_07340 [Agromyces badenianii]PWC04220.1 hypothetical protein DCE94_08675 [Agromyces badenianii]